LGEEKGAVIYATSAEFEYVFARFFSKPIGVEGRLGWTGFFGGEERPYGGGVVHVVREECSELRSEGVKDVGGGRGRWGVEYFCVLEGGRLVD
jgi:hypothetical protein